MKNLMWVKAVVMATIVAFALSVAQAGLAITASMENPANAALYAAKTTKTVKTTKSPTYNQPYVIPRNVQPKPVIIPNRPIGSGGGR